MTSRLAHTFALNRNIFNDSLYSRLRSFWFAGLPQDARIPNQENNQRWFGMGVSADEKAAFDAQCRSNFGPALESINPKNVNLPPFESHAQDLANADAISGPFIAEVRDANSQSGEKGAATLLALCLLLDQMPRNIHRDVDGLQLVYKHYDRMAWTLLRSALALDPSPIMHPCYALKPVYRMWFPLPFEHAEDPESHSVIRKLLAETESQLKAAGDDEAARFWETPTSQAKKHKDIIDRFGRYPHRNECLGRESTKEELEYLKSGDTFGVKQGMK